MGEGQFRCEPPPAGGVVVVVTGGRAYRNFRLVRTALDSFHAEHGIGLLVHGAAGNRIYRHSIPGDLSTPRTLKGIEGADLLAEEWAIYNRVPFAPYPVTDDEWRTIGKRAGPLRNQRMLDERRPGWCIHFPGGRGTADMVERARKFGCEMVGISEENPHGARVRAWVGQQIKADSDGG